MDISISDAASTISAAAPTSLAPSIHPTHHTVDPDDTVKLSESQQVQALVQQGDSVEQIATGLSLSTAIVESYLGIQATVPAPSPTPAPQSQAKSISVSATSKLTNG
jgi:hypothetical protein